MPRKYRAPLFAKGQRVELEANAKAGWSEEAIYEKAKDLCPSLTHRQWVQLRASLGLGPKQKAAGGLGRVHPDRKRIWDYGAVYELMYACLEAGPEATQAEVMKRAVPVARELTGRENLSERTIAQMITAIHMGKAQRNREAKGQKASKMPIPRFAVNPVKNARRDFLLGKKAQTRAAKRKGKRPGRRKGSHAKPVRVTLKAPERVEVKRQPVGMTPKATNGADYRQRCKALAMAMAQQQLDAGELDLRAKGSLRRAIQDAMAEVDSVD